MSPLPAETLADLSKLTQEPSEWHPLVAKTFKGMSEDTYHRKGLFYSRNGSFKASVSRALIPRASALLDRLWRVLESIGAKADPPRKKEGYLSIELDGGHVAFGVSEPTRKVPRPLTAEEKKKLAKDPDAYIYDRAPLQPSGELVVVLYTDSFFERQRFKDGTKTLEEQLPRIVDRIRSLAVSEREHAKQLAEQHRLYEEEAARSEARRAAADEQLVRLRKAEDAAVQWERAERLRAYTAALEAKLLAEGADLTPNQEWGQKLAWLKRAADWLDPLVRVPWPGVDGAPAPHWWGQYQRDMGIRPSY